MITVLDYGGGNLASLEGALDAFDLPFRRAATPAEAAASGTLVLPGDGHFASARRGLVERGWWDAELLENFEVLLRGEQRLTDGAAAVEERDRLPTIPATGN